MGVNKEALTRFSALASLIDWYGTTFEDTEAWTIKHLDEFCAVWDYMTQKCTLSYDVDGHRWSVTRRERRTGIRRHHGRRFRSDRHGTMGSGFDDSGR